MCCLYIWSRYDQGNTGYGRRNDHKSSYTLARSVALAPTTYIKLGMVNFITLFPPPGCPIISDVYHLWNLPQSHLWYVLIYLNCPLCIEFHILMRLMRVSDTVWYCTVGISWISVLLLLLWAMIIPSVYMHVSLVSTDACNPHLHNI